MKVLHFLKDVLILIAAICFSILFFVVYYPIFGVWYIYQVIKQHINTHRNHGATEG